MVTSNQLSLATKKTKSATKKICKVHPKVCFCNKPVASPKHALYPDLCDNCRRSWINTKLDVSFADWKKLRAKVLKLA